MANTINIFNQDGSSLSEYAVNDACLEFEKGDQAVHDVVVAYMAGLRAGTASTKTRSEVKGGGQKPFRQKGMGRARGGSRVSPVWRGGGVIFGPQPRSYAKKVNKKTRKLALKRAFSERVKEESVIIVDNIDIPDHKTKNVKNILNNLKVESALVVVDDYNENLLKATGNIADIMLIKAASVNVYQLLRFDKIIFTQAGIDTFVKRFAEEAAE